MRPQINPGLRRVWRGRDTVQIGLTPETGVVIDGLDQRDADLLDRLDGTRRLGELVDWGRRRGLAGGRVEAMVALLDRAGVLTGAPTDRAHLASFPTGERERLRPDALAWSVTYPGAGDGYELLAGRGRRQVLVVGRGRLAGATRAAVRRTGLQVGAVEDGGPLPAADLTVLVGADTVSPSAAAALLGAGASHLAVVEGTDRVVVGPLVVPGRTPCLRCLELHRTDRDPGWPAVSAQLGVHPGTARGERTLLTLVAGAVALQCLCWFDARCPPASLGATLTFALPHALPARRVWSAHPRCGCGWLPASLPADATAAFRGH